MLSRQFQIFILVGLLGLPCMARDLAVIYSFDCNPKGQYGSISENQVSVLKKFGWDVHYYCGSDLGKSQKGAALKEGALTANNIIFGLKRLDVSDGDNVMVILNSPGEIKDQGVKYTMPDPKNQGVITFQENSNQCSKTAFQASEYMRLFSAIEQKNPSGKNILINSSGYGGACIFYVPEDSNMCVFTGAPEDEVGLSDNYLAIAFQGLPESEKNFYSKIDETAVDPENINQIPLIQKEENPTLKKRKKHLRSLRSKIKFSNYTLNEILRSSLWFDQSGTVAVYTHGFNLDELNVSDDDGFIHQYMGMLEHFKPDVRKVAEKVILDLQDRIGLINKNPGNQTTQSKRRIDEKKSLLRNQLMSLAISETQSSCGTFNLDRRKK